MPIQFNSKLSSNDANNTFLDKGIDDIKTGVLTLRKAPVDTDQIDDAQAFINEIATIQGTVGENDPNARSYSSEVIIANGDDRKAAIGKLDAQVAVNRDDNDAQDILITNNTRTTFANEAIADLTAISKSETILTQVRRISGDAAAVNAATTPFGDCTNVVDGVVIILRGTDDTNTVTVTNNDIQFGALLNGDAILGLYDELEIMYDNVLERWIEQRRNF